MDNSHSEKDTKKGSSILGSAASSSAKKVASSNASKQLAAAVFANPLALILFAIILLILIIISVVMSAAPMPSIFNDETTDVGEVAWTLNDGYEAKKQEAISDIVAEIDSRYPDFYIKYMGIPRYDHGYSFTYDDDKRAVDIDVLYAPDVSEFAEMVNAYANAVNGAIVLFQGEDAKDALNTSINVEDNILILDDSTGQYDVSDYYKGLSQGLNNQYIDSQVPDFFDSLAEQSYSIFSYDRNTDNWIWNLKETRKRKSREITTCTYTSTGTGKGTSSSTFTVDGACQVMKGFEGKQGSRTEYYYIPYLTGSVTVYMACDIEQFKRSDIDQIKASLIGDEIIVNELSADGDVLPVRKILDANMASMLVDEAISTYYASYIASLVGGTFVSGYSGYITSGGWNYANLINADSSISNAFWGYAESLRSVLKALPYAKYHLSSGGMAYPQNCTMFAAVFFYDVYGFSALRGDGNHQADNLIVDCGVDNENSCPVKFARSVSPAPGAIVSLYPNHVIVVNEVKDDGTVLISEGNVNSSHAIRTNIEYSSLNAYASANGMTIKSIAVPVK